MIKKYITLAALLSAGTALANANIEYRGKTWEKLGETKITTTFESTSGASTITTGTNAGGAKPTVGVSGYISSAVSITDVNSDRTLIGDGNAATGASSIVPNIDMSQGQEWTLNFTYNFSQLVSQVQFLAASAGGVEHTLKIDSVSLRLGATDRNGDFLPEYDGNYYTFTVAFAPGDGLTTTTRLENHRVTATGVDHALHGTAPQGNPITIPFPTSRDQSLTPTADTKFSLTVGRGESASRTGSIGIQSITFNASVLKNVPNPVTPPSPSVPEPSAFGLLAGLGALALVASRRRRK